MVSIYEVLTLGHTDTDSERQKKLKSAYTAMLITIAAYSVVLMLLPDRSRLEIVLDVIVVLALGVCGAILWNTKSIPKSFLCLFVCAMPIMAAFYFLHGNRDGDFYFFILIPPAAIAFIGPRRSRVYFILTIVGAAAILLVDPLLPKMKHAWHLTPMNKQGWLFHAQDKYLMKTTEAGTFFGVTTVVYYLIHSAASALSQANRKIETLLLNVLPRSVAGRLMDAELESDRATIVENFDEATILFADIVGFTRLSQNLSPGELINFLNDLFSAFDALADKHAVEKIKTIGDAYMVVSGLPEPDDQHAERIADMALDMLATTQRFNVVAGEVPSLRIGINSGPVVAGVIGRRKFIYDLWGDAVNTASRMESYSSPGIIQTTTETYEILKDKFEFEPIGRIDIKGKGELDTWRLIGRKS